MRKWEDIVKDKLGGYESNLPEDSLAAFHAHRTTAGATKAKRFPFVWAFVPAIAAGLAAVLLLMKPTLPEDGVQMIPQPVETDGRVNDSLVTTTPPATAPLIALATRTTVVRPVLETTQSKEPAATTIVEEIHISDAPPIPETDDFGPRNTLEEPATDIRPVEQDSSPFVPQPLTEKPAIRFNPGNGGAIAAGGGLLAALATQFSRTDLSVRVPGPPDTDAIGSPVKTPSHRMPLVVGLSIRYPVTDKLGITTGVEYSLYSSTFSYPPREKTLLVHYLGFPVRLDWTFAAGKWMEAYLGAGVKGDLCMGATLAGKTIGNDGPAFRLLGAGGIQYNAPRNLSLFVEPEISWTLPSDSRILSTYSSEHPWMFTVATGVRINFGK